MKTRCALWTALFLAFLNIHAPAATLYVNLNSTNPVSPYASWSTAATNIQDAVDASTNGDLILVTNGVYQTVGSTAPDGWPTSVVVTNGITLQSVNGATATLINGSGMRCVYMFNDALLQGFTLFNGHAANGGGAFGGTLVSCVLTNNSAFNGGGAASNVLFNCILSFNHAASPAPGSYGGGACGCMLSNCLVVGNNGGDGGGAAFGTLTSCVVSNNSASYGGGVFLGVANDSLISSNKAAYGGGAYSNLLTDCVLQYNTAAAGGGANDSTLMNCTVVSNTAPNLGSVATGGGIVGGTAKNCIIYYNFAYRGSNFFFYSTSNTPVNSCCTTPLPTNGLGNITNEPALVGLTEGDFHLQSNSPCINVGNNAYVTSRTDLNGNARIVNGTVDMGAYEYQGNIRYVSLDSTNPIAPYSDWSIAATNIQDAIDASTNGDLILVTNGVYRTGGRMVNGYALTNRVVIDKAVTVQSVNGPAVTAIEGFRGTSPNYLDPIRCVWLTNHATLTGFMLTNGYTLLGMNASDGFEGGGVYCLSTSAMVSNCVLIGNEAGLGGGAYGGTLINCLLTNNAANPGTGGGAESSTLFNCVLAGNLATYGGAAAYATLTSCTISYNLAGDNGGGALSCTLNNCILTQNNSNSGNGGGSFGGTLSNCTVSHNFSGGEGGGAYFGTLNNCLIVHNGAQVSGGGASGGMLISCTISSNSVVDPNAGFGVSSATLNNCIVYYNSGPYSNGDTFSCIPENCCIPDVTGTGNITNAPLFVDPASGDFHLQSNSPCINSGNNAYVALTNDLDGNPRIVGGTVDIGAYEYQTPVSKISYAWLQQYGLPITTNTDTANPDGDGMNNYQEWIAGTNPTNALSFLAMFQPVPTNNPAGLIVSWESVSNRTYFLQSSTNLAAQPAFSTIQSNIVGQPDMTSFLDTNAVGNGPFFYRVGVQ